MAHLLVVDDEPRIARFVSRALESHGHTVEVARTGEDALVKAAEHDFALVILDMLLPGLDGHAVLRELLARDSRNRVHGLRRRWVIFSVRPNTDSVQKWW